MGAAMETLSIQVHSGLTADNGQPVITACWGEQRGYFTPASGRRQAFALLMTAEMAEGDAIWQAACSAEGLDQSTLAAIRRRVGVMRNQRLRDGVLDVAVL
jgi:hypothetical protein